MKMPKIVYLTSDETQSLIQRIMESGICARDKETIKNLCEGYTSLKGHLYKLAVDSKGMFDLLGMKSKKYITYVDRLIELLTFSKNNQTDDDTSNTQQPEQACEENANPENADLVHENADQEPPAHGNAANQNVAHSTEQTSAEDDTNKNKPNHGRHKNEEYTRASTVCHTHEHLKAGDICPHCGLGKMYSISPCITVTFNGGPLITAIRHLFNRLRCSRCGYIDKVLPAAGFTKYAPSCMASLAIFRYYAALPFARLERLQALSGIPLAAGTQWDIMLQMYNSVLPVFLSLFRLAANAGLIHYDDTWVRILSMMKENKYLEELERKGMFTTGILAKIDVSADLSHFIVLFLSGRKHAGENMNELLKNRNVDDVLITMSDASTCNILDWLITITCKCLSHALRKFTEIETVFSEECGVILGFLRSVYKNEEVVKKEKMTDHERLNYHQENSKPLMESLKSYLETHLSEKKVEPNSSLGKAIAYTLKHWDGLTQFLTVEGAPIDNNSMEQALKLQIRSRKNSLFYKNEFGAYVGSVLTSVIVTCERNQCNPFDYLETVALYETEVAKNPEAWLPWNFKETLQTLPRKKTLSWANAPPDLQAA